MTDHTPMPPPMPPAPERRPRVFLYLAAAMVLLAILAYLFEEALYDLTLRDATFVYVLVFAVIGALFFLMCYRFPKLGLPLLGKSVYVADDADGERGDYHWSLGFKQETATDFKRASSRRKLARHARKEAARNTPSGPSQGADRA